jgi:hypothetical protein
LIYANTAPIRLQKSACRSKKKPGGRATGPNYERERRNYVS